MKTAVVKEAKELCTALGAQSGRFVLPFCFKNDDGTRTSHHLIFVSKHVLGYTIMKGIMATQSSLHEQGVPSFQYNPADRRFPLLFELNRPLDDLEGLLLVRFSDQTLAMKEENGTISCEPAERRKNTMGDDVLIAFPPQQRR